MLPVLEKMMIASIIGDIAQPIERGAGVRARAVGGAAAVDTEGGGEGEDGEEGEEGG